MKTMWSKKLTGRLCAAVTYGLLFTMAGQAEAADYSLYGATVGETVIKDGDDVLAEAANGSNTHIAKANSALNSLEAGAAFTVLGGDWLNVYGGIGKSSSETRDNTITLSGGKVTIIVCGGDAGSSTTAVVSNTVNIQGSASVNMVYGGRVNVSSNVNVESNEVNISGGTVKDNTYGGFANGNAIKNQVVITDTTYSGTFIVGGLSRSDEYKADGNSVTIKGGIFNNSIDGNTVEGGSASSIATNNIVNIEGGTFESYASVYGGKVHTEASNNTVNISRGTFNVLQIIQGGSSQGGITSNNVVNISGGSIIGTGFSAPFYYGICGGYDSGGMGTALGNVVNISGGTFKDIRITGAWGQAGTNNNTVNISGGSFENVNVYAVGNATTASCAGSGNAVNLIGVGGELNGISHSGGALSLGSVGSGSGSGNILNIAGTDTTVTDISGFANVNFNTSSTIANGSTVLTATGTANVTGAKINATMSGMISDGTITLLKAATLTDADSYSINGTEVSLGARLINTGDNTNYLALRYTTLDKLENSLQLSNETWGAIGKYNGVGKDAIALTETESTAGIKNVAGAYSDTGDSIGGIASIRGGSFENVYGGYSENGAARDNTVNISGGTVTNVYGGQGTAVSGNTINILGGKVTGKAAGNEAGAGTGLTVNQNGGDISEATVAAENFSYSGGIIAGATINAVNLGVQNDVTLNEKITANNVVVSDGKTATIASSGKINNISGGILSAAGTGNSVGNISGASQINLTANDKHNNVLSVTGNASLAGTAVNLLIDNIKDADINTTSFLSASTISGAGSYTINGEERGTVSQTNENYVAAKQVKLDVADNGLKLQKVTGTWIYGGIVDGTSNTKSTLTINGDTPADGDYYAGAYSSSGDASGGTVEIKANTDKTIYGGYSVNGAATGNTISVIGTKDASVAVGTILAGYSGKGSEFVTGNVINVTYGAVGTIDLVNANNKLYLNDGASYTTLKNGSQENVYQNRIEALNDSFDAGDTNVALSGGVGSGATVKGNNIDLTGGAVAGTVNANNDVGISGGEVSGTVNAENNVKISGGTVSGTANANKNSEISNGTISGKVNAKDNANISGGEVSGSITAENNVNVSGGTISGTATANKKAEISNGIISGTVIGKESASITGGEITGKVASNGALSISNGATLNGGTLEGNSVAADSANIKGTVVAEGHMTISGTTSVDTESNLKANTMTMNSGNVAGNLTADTVTVNEGKVSGSLNAGALAINGGSLDGITKAENMTMTAGTISDTANVTVGKELKISGGVIDGKADITAASSIAEISGNAVINGTIAGNGDENNGTVITISSGTLGEKADILAYKIILCGNVNTDGFMGRLAAHIIDLKTTLKGRGQLYFTGSELFVRTLGNTASTIGFAKPEKGGELNFYIPSDAVSGDTMLSLNSNTDISNSKVTVGVQSGSKLKVNDTVNLIKMEDSAALTANDLSFPVPSESVIKTENLSKVYGITTAAKENGLVATITKVGPGENAKSYAETMAANIAMLNMSSDLAAGLGMEQAGQAAGMEASPSMVPFAAIGGGNVRSNSGSYVNNRIWGITTGLAKTVANKSGKLLFGPMVEYSKGNYDSHLDNGTRGDGQSHSWGVGFFAKQALTSGTYLEGSIRAGKITADYNSVEMGSYDTASPYFAAHIGIGKINKLSKTDSIDLYGKYFFTHQNGADVAINDHGSSDEYHFDSVNSSRTKLGFRWSHQMNENSSIYFGTAWQYEFAGTARASYAGEFTPSPSVKGATGLLELGCKFKPANGNLEANIGFNGSVGKQQGIGVHASLQWAF